MKIAGPFGSLIVHGTRIDGRIVTFGRQRTGDVMNARRSSPRALCDLSNRLIEVQGSGSRTCTNGQTARWIADTDTLHVTGVRVQIKWNSCQLARLIGV